MNYNSQVKPEKKYFPGKLLVLINEYYNKRKQIKKEGNHISQWKLFVERFFSEKCNYSNIMSRDDKEWTFNSGYRTLPLIFKSKFDENVELIATDFQGPEEYSASDGKYLLVINNFSKIEKYSDGLVSTQGMLRVLYDENFKIEIFEFLSKNHQEIPTKKESGASLVNIFGITPQFSRTLIISEALTEMDSSINEFVSKFDN